MNRARVWEVCGWTLVVIGVAISMLASYTEDNEMAISFRIAGFSLAFAGGSMLAFLEKEK